MPQPTVTSEMCENFFSTDPAGTVQDINNNLAFLDADFTVPGTSSNAPALLLFANTKSLVEKQQLAEALLNWISVHRA